MKSSNFRNCVSNRKKSLWAKTARGQKTRGCKRSYERFKPTWRSVLLWMTWSTILKSCLNKSIIFWLTMLSLLYVDKIQVSLNITKSTMSTIDCAMDRWLIAAKIRTNVTMPSASNALPNCLACLIPVDASLSECIDCNIYSKHCRSAASYMLRKKKQKETKQRCESFLHSEPDFNKCCIIPIHWVGTNCRKFLSAALIRHIISM